ncbi:FISUMP domain-containing protein [uncultured Draconibacterium sp.]|uniref:FISUMP domain-containing protein n=1 Tax=uncultured Draconibacterium sp. TaxID=1573823 RepID=UPI0029C62889|nr:FISUMP domain-containing protein [uncultured Draconibacterium sp.]
MKEESISTKLQELFDLYKSGVLEKLEYDSLKAELLNKSENLLPKQSETKNKPEIDEGNTDKEKPKIQDETNLSVLQQKLKSDPLNIDLLHKYAQSLYKEGNYKEAITTIHKVLSLIENDAEAEKLLLNSYIKLNRYEDAISALRKWISENPNEPRHKDKLVEVKSLYDNYKRKRNRNKIIAISSVVVIIVLIVLSIFVENNSEKKLALEKEKTAYELVKQKQLVSPCMEYLHDYPNGLYVAEVKALQEDFQWKEAKTSNTIHSYEKYILLYPNGRYVEEANDAKNVIIDKIERNKQDLNTTSNKSNAAIEKETNILANEKRDQIAKNQSFFTDNRDNITYKTIKIGNQIWMAENLAYNAGDGCWAYENNESNVETYGRLYNWETAKIACPSGWHLPTDDEWKQMEMAIGMSQGEADEIGSRGTDEGTKLKATGGWYKNGNGTDDYGFSGLAGGCRYDNGAYFYIGEDGIWWSATEVYDEAYCRSVNYAGDRFTIETYHKEYGVSVRCIRD